VPAPTHQPLSIVSHVVNPPNMGPVRARPAGSSRRRAPGLPTELDADLRRLVEASHGPARQERSARLRRLRKIFGELAAAGVSLQSVKQLQLADAKQLVLHWVRDGRAESTIRSDWSRLRTILRDAGVEYSNVSLDAVWPAEALGAKDVRGGNPRRGKAAAVDVLSLAATDDDPTYYLVEQVRASYRTSIRQALELPFAFFREVGNGIAPSSGRRQVLEAIAGAPEASRQLAAQVASFLMDSERAQLLWTGLDIARGVRKHENHLSYLRRRAQGSS